MTDDDRLEFAIQGVPVQVSRADVLAAVRRRQPEPQHPGSPAPYLVRILRRDLPARWVLRRTLEHLAATSTDADPRAVPPDTRGQALDPRQAVRILKALGFPTIP